MNTHQPAFFVDPYQRRSSPPRPLSSSDSASDPEEAALRRDKGKRVRQEIEEEGLPFAVRRDISDTAVLSEIAESVGIPKNVGREAWSRKKAGDELEKRETEAREDREVTGVPWFVFTFTPSSASTTSSTPTTLNSALDLEDPLIRFTMVGAQDVESFLRMLNRASDRAVLAAERRRNDRGSAKM
ncbi:hypothetical protein HDU93_002961 [Gonapodya sp. JEL0774]|nr:hypothetical protein HDU93_002961 [Gonapodya sp. JEL0774]